MVIILLSFLFQSYIQKSTGTEVKIKDGRTRYDHREFLRIISLSMIDLTISFTGNYVHEPLSNSFKSSGSIIAHARNERCDRHWQVNGSTCSRSMNLARLKNQKKINGQNPCNESRYQVEERSLTFPDKNSWLSLSLSLSPFVTCSLHTFTSAYR